MTERTLILIGLLLGAVSAWAGHRHADHLLHGTITGNGQPVTAQFTEYQVECRKQTDAPPMAAYQMGERAAFGDQYGLRIPLQVQAASSDPTVCQPGDTVFILVVNQGQVLVQESFTIPEPGLATRLDLEFWGMVTTAQAGADQEVCGTCTTLTANAPTVGQGSWQIISGVGGSLADPSDPNTSFSGEPNEIYGLQWLISHDVYPSSSDTVSVAFFEPMTADAGPDQVSCDETLTLQGNAPRVGQGEWTIESGSNGYLADAHQPDTRFMGMDGETYQLRWSITDEPCEESSDTVTVTILPRPEAGPNQLVCGTQTMLEATPPVPGPGTWNVEEGIGGYFADEHDPLTDFFGLEGETYTLTWSVSEPGVCTRSDGVTIQFSGFSCDIVSTQTSVCDLDQGLPLFASARCGNTPYSYAWSIVDGPAAGGTLSSSTGASTEFFAEGLGMFLIQLNVTDALGESSTSTHWIFALDPEMDGIPGLSWSDWLQRVPYWQSTQVPAGMDLDMDGQVSVRDLLLPLSCMPGMSVEEAP